MYKLACPLENVWAVGDNGTALARYRLSQTFFTAILKRINLNLEY